MGVSGKMVGGGIVAMAVLAGAGVWWTQEYAFYSRISAQAPVEIRLVSVETGQPEPILSDSFDGIDAESSPLRFRACFHTPMTLAMLTETFKVYDKATPLNGPNWFSCYDAAKIGADLETGAAVAFLSEQNIHPGVDRVVAVYPDGRAYVWQQLNDDAEK